jgi:putative hydrolase of the HAD superfamily
MVVVFDLDDTLYDEVEFVKSGFKEISAYLGSERYYLFMMEEFEKNGSGKVFDKLLQEYEITTPLEKLIEIYRFHKPKITLPKETQTLLQFTQKYKTALISDGHYITQQNKFDTLGLAHYIDYPIFTDFHHTRKPQLKPFEMVMKQYTDETYIYISDNPKKDFIAPNQLAWKTIRFKNSVGIYKNFKNDALYEVTNRKDIKNILEKLATTLKNN